MYCMIGTAVVTMPEGMVKGPERVLPKNSVLKITGSLRWVEYGSDYTVLNTGGQVQNPVLTPGTGSRE